MSTRRPAVKSGKDTAAPLRIALTLAQTGRKTPRTSWILCPWLQRFPGDAGIWLSVLAAHDANGGLLEALPSSGRSRPDVYAAVFAVDVLRTSTQLIRAIKNAGIGGVINFPSMSFVDGEAGAVLNDLSLGIDREIDFLETCAKQGLRIAGVVGSVPPAQRLLKIGVDFLIVHNGPPLRGDRDSGREVSIELEKLARTRRVPFIPLSRLQRSGRSPRFDRPRNS